MQQHRYIHAHKKLTQTVRDARTHTQQGRDPEGSAAVRLTVDTTGQQLVTYSSAPDSLLLRSPPSASAATRLPSPHSSDGDSDHPYDLSLSIQLTATSCRVL